MYICVVCVCNRRRGTVDYCHVFLCYVLCVCATEDMVQLTIVMCSCVSACVVSGYATEDMVRLTVVKASYLPNARFHEDKLDERE